MRAWMALMSCAAVALVAGVSTGSAGNGDKNKCLNGGWKTLYRIDATTFKNEDKCIDYLRSGGKVFSKVADVSLGAIVTIFSIHNQDGDAFLMHVGISASNAGPSPVTVDVRLVYSTGCGETGAVTTHVTVPVGETVSAGGFTTSCSTPGGSFFAQVTSADAADPDSIPNNHAFSGSPAEDDEI